MIPSFTSALSARTLKDEKITRSEDGRRIISASYTYKSKKPEEDMENYLAACDLVISRAGALSVAETTVCGKAAVLIPSPNVTGNHQYYNAKAVADRGGAVLLEEKDLTAETLIREVMRLKNNPRMLSQMGHASRACAPDKALDIIYGTIRDIAGK